MKSSLLCLLAVAASTVSAVPQSQSQLQLQSQSQAQVQVQAPLPYSSPRELSTKALLSLHKQLVKQSSISGDEHGVGTWLVNYLLDHGFTIEKQVVSSSSSAKSGGSSHNRFNILAYPGTKRKTTTLVTSHIDTVPPFWPYEVRGSQIWGRGSVDAKGSVATQIAAVESLLSADEIGEGDVALLFVVGEETSGDGMRAANDLGLSWDTVIFGEPTELKLASGHKGILHFTLTAKGKAGHSGYPELGRNANAMLVPALHALLTADFPASEKYGNTTLNLGRMSGGVAANVIAEDASAIVAMRLAAGTPAEVEKIVLDTVEKAGEELDLQFGAGYPPVDIDCDIPGFENFTVNYGTDIPHLKGDHKRYLYGPGAILVAHSDHEHLEIEDLEKAVEGYKTLIRASLEK